MAETDDKVLDDSLKMASPEFLQLILAEADKRLEGQIQLSLAKDARAGGLLSASVSLAAAGLTVATGKLSSVQALFGSGKAIHVTDPLFAAAIVFSLTCALAALAAVRALWPVGLDLKGWVPNLFADDIRQVASNTKTLDQVRAEMAFFANRRIVSNSKVGEKLARRVKASMALLVLAPVNAIAGCLLTDVRLFGVGAAVIALDLAWVTLLACGLRLPIRPRPRPTE